MEIPEVEPPKRRLRQVDLKKFFKIDDHTEKVTNIIPVILQLLKAYPIFVLALSNE